MTIRSRATSDTLLNLRVGALRLIDSTVRAATVFQTTTTLATHYSFDDLEPCSTVQPTAVVASVIAREKSP
jgi:hypothetical protein